VHYDFLPKSVIARFIVKSHHDIKGKLRWRTGVVLENSDYETTASVRADEVDKVIYIRVNGERRRDHLSVIRHTLREINNSFENLQTTESVSLPDHPEITVEYEELTGHEAGGKTEIYIGKLRKAYSVKLLLDGIEEPGARAKHDFDRKSAEKYQTPPPPQPQPPPPEHKFWKIVIYLAAVITILAGIIAIIQFVL
jgi:hypothetical protein